MDLNDKSEKALPPDRVEPKWPTPTVLRRYSQVPNKISNHISKYSLCLGNPKSTLTQRFEDRSTSRPKGTQRHIENLLCKKKIFIE